jgi:hypothetical protein
MTWYQKSKENDKKKWTFFSNIECRGMWKRNCGGKGSCIMRTKK